MLGVARCLALAALAGPAAAHREEHVEHVEQQVKAHQQLEEQPAVQEQVEVHLEPNQYVLRFYNRYGREAVERGRRWVVPVKCKNLADPGEVAPAMYWEVTSMLQHDLSNRIADHCLVVTCKMNNRIEVKPWIECPDGYGTFNSRHKTRLAIASDASELTETDGLYKVFGYFRVGKRELFSGRDYQAHRGLVADTDINVFYQKELNSMTFRDPRYPQECEEIDSRPEVYNPHGLPLPEDAASTQACIQKGTALHRDCIANAQALQDSSAYGAKCLEHRYHWNDLLQKLGACAKWDEQNSCPPPGEDGVVTLTEEQSTREENKSGLFNTWFSSKHECEKELKEEGKLSERKCERRGYASFCTSEFVTGCLATRYRLKHESE